MSASVFYLFIFIFGSFGACACVCAVVAAVVVGRAALQPHKRTPIETEEGEVVWLIFFRFLLFRVSFEMYLSQNLWAKVIISGFRSYVLLQMHFVMRLRSNILNAIATYLDSPYCVGAGNVLLWPNFLEMRNNKFYYLLRVTNIIKINCFFIFIRCAIPTNNGHKKWLIYDSIRIRNDAIV